MARETSGDRKEELRQSEQRFKLLVSSIRDYAIFMLDPSGDVLTWNAGAERFKGSSPRNHRAALFAVLPPVGVRTRTA